jgi:hypothetical protein
MKEQLIQTVTTNPELTFITGLGLSAALILADLKTGVSLNMPGRGRIGLAGLIAGTTALLYYFSKGGITAILNEIASGIVGALLVTVLIGFYLQNK